MVLVGGGRQIDRVLIAGERLLHAEVVIEPVGDRRPDAEVRLRMDALHRLGERTDQAVVFTVAPKTAFLMAFWTLGKLFPRTDRSPVMVPHAHETLGQATTGSLTRVDRVSRGFYISECLEYRA